MRSSHFSLIAGMVPLFGGAFAKWNPDSQTNLAVYWGQGLAQPGVDQNDAKANPYNQTLDQYCASQKNIDIYSLSFLVNLTEPVLNFGWTGAQGKQCSADPMDTNNNGVNVLTCGGVANSIQKCQDNSDKTMLLTIGGDTFGETGWNDPEAAKKAAQTLWQQFGPKDLKLRPVPYRPFEDAVVNGFNLDFPRELNGSKEFAQELRTILDRATNNNAGSQPFILTATPQCPRDFQNATAPLVTNVDMLNSVHFDALWVQYYNNAQCDIRQFNPKKKWADKDYAFNLEDWTSWARTKAAKGKTNTKILMSLAGSPAAAPAGGYGRSEIVDKAIKKALNLAHFGGVSVWELQYAINNGNWLSSIASALGKNSTSTS